MLIKTKAIVLHRIKYSDNSLIVKCFTEKFGLRSYILKGVLNAKKSGIRKAYFQSLSQLNLVTYNKPNKDLQHLKEVNVTKQYESLQTDIVKQTLVLFLSEMLMQSLKEENDPDVVLYAFLERSLNWLDVNDKVANFHLSFLLKLSRYLGFAPQEPKDTHFFDLQEGQFVDKPVSSYFIQKPLLNYFKSLLGSHYDSLSKIPIDATQRKELLNIIIQYYSLHIQSFKAPKSLPVLQNLF